MRHSAGLAAAQLPLKTLLFPLKILSPFLRRAPQCTDTRAFVCQPSLGPALPRKKPRWKPLISSGCCAGPCLSFSSSASAAGAAKGGIGGLRDASLVEIPVKAKPRKFFDAKTFREFIKKFKEGDKSKEEKHIQQKYARPPPEGWGPADFLRRIGLEEHAVAIAAHFNSWGEFVCASPEDLMSIESLTNAQRRLLLRHLRLFNNGLWPENSYEDYLARFQAEPLGREGLPWTEEEDANLLSLAKKYDPNFGDPWLFLSWELKRDFEDVHKRYLHLVEIPKNRGRRCEFVLSKCMRPLYFSRYFKILPSTLVIVPSASNFDTSAVSKFEVSPPFRCFRG